VCFGLFFLLFSWGEHINPWRIHGKPFKERWGLHFTLLMLSTLLVRAVSPVLLVELAIKVRVDHPWSLLGLPELSWLPIWGQCVVGFLGLDFLLYWQHRMMHRVGLLWRLHLMHHTDQVLDASTGIRFHPLEFLFSFGFKMLAVIFIGPPVIVVIVFEIVLNAASMFTHANIHVPKTWDDKLRYMFVTPPMHRIHHSDIVAERNSNFGFFLSWWDRMLGTYKPISAMRDNKLVLGVEEYYQQKTPSLGSMLLLPFHKIKRRKRKAKARKWMQISDNDAF
jgi:sterol desaturase/sphingolipid hydroxylase (fatty acid hydroxylase superfamily)